MEILIASIGTALVLLFIRDRWRSTADDRYLRDVIGRMGKEQLQRQFEASCAVTARQLIDPRRSGISAADSAKHLQRAVYCKDRLQFLEGREHGPAFRERFRTELARYLQGIADARRAG
jgi:hypothetical protein